MTHWQVPRRWPGETVFIIGGGPSVLDQEIESLRGRHVIVINSSYQIASWADYLIFSDDRWWDDPPTYHGKKAREVFKGEIVAATQSNKNGAHHLLKRKKPPGLASDCDTVSINFTTYTAAINLAAHLIGKGGGIVCLGLDGTIAKDGRTHHHAPHPWRQMAGCWDKQRDDLRSIVAPLKAMNVEVINCSPGSKVPFWPVMPLADHLAAENQ